MNVPSPAPKSAPRSKRGFTLVELVLVLTILAVLMGAAIYQMNNAGFFEQAADQTIQGDVRTIGIALQNYRNAAGRFPTTEQGLQALVEKPTTGIVPDKWFRGLEKVPVDPWKQPYKYRFPATKSKAEYDVYSLGKDGQENTADDVGNWEAAPAK